MALTQVHFGIGSRAQQCSHALLAVPAGEAALLKLAAAAARVRVVLPPTLYHGLNARPVEKGHLGARLRADWNGYTAAIGSSTGEPVGCGRRAGGRPPTAGTGGRRLEGRSAAATTMMGGCPHLQLPQPSQRRLSRHGAQLGPAGRIAGCSAGPAALEAPHRAPGNSRERAGRGISVPPRHGATAANGGRVAGRLQEAMRCLRAAAFSADRAAKYCNRRLAQNGTPLTLRAVDQDAPEDTLPARFPLCTPAGPCRDAAPRQSKLHKHGHVQPLFFASQGGACHTRIQCQQCRNAVEPARRALPPSSAL